MQQTLDCESHRVPLPRYTTIDEMPHCLHVQTLPLYSTLPQRKPGEFDCIVHKRRSERDRIHLYRKYSRLKPAMLHTPFMLQRATRNSQLAPRTSQLAPRSSQLLIHREMANIRLAVAGIPSGNSARRDGARRGRAAGHRPGARGDGYPSRG